MYFKWNISYRQPRLRLRVSRPRHIWVPGNQPMLYLSSHLTVCVTVFLSMHDRLSRPQHFWVSGILSVCLYIVYLSIYRIYISIYLSYIPIYLSIYLSAAARMCGGEWGVRSVIGMSLHLEIFRKREKLNLNYLFFS